MNTFIDVSTCTFRVIYGIEITIEPIKYNIRSQTFLCNDKTTVTGVERYLLQLSIISFYNSFPELQFPIKSIHHFPPFHSLSFPLVSSQTIIRLSLSFTHLSIHTVHTFANYPHPNRYHFEFVSLSNDIISPRRRSTRCVRSNFDRPELI